MVIKYTPPTSWLRYDHSAIIGDLLEAKTAVLSLTSVPFQRSWTEKLQQVQLKHEVAGTSKIEGAEFTEGELDAAMSEPTPDEILTRSQRQARAAVVAYRWIASLSADRPVSKDLILEIHMRLVRGCDEDHCEPGALRQAGHNVTFGAPRHRGVEGGKECGRAFEELCGLLNTEFRAHDILVRALALHYHLGAMHPFGDGNGRTARAVEALMLQSAGLRDALFIALSNYYYDEKKTYLSTLAAVRGLDHDLTPFLKFGLKGITLQCRRLLQTINTEIRKALFRDMANSFFGKLESPKKRVLAKRQLSVLYFLLDRGPTSIGALVELVAHLYAGLKDRQRGMVRDLAQLQDIGAITIVPEDGVYIVSVNLQWPEEITETEFFRRAQKLPSAKTYRFLQRQS